MATQPLDQNEQSEGELLARIRTGDPAALERVYNAHARDLIGFAGTYLPIETAKDVVQDVFLSIWNHRNSLNVTNGLRAYLFGAVKRRVRDIKRHEAVEKKFEARAGTDYSLAAGRGETGETGAGESSPETNAELSDLHQAVDEVLATLSEEHRTLLTLRWHYGMTYDQAAHVLGISANAAKKQGQRLEARLRPLFEKFRS